MAEFIYPPITNGLKTWAICFVGGELDKWSWRFIQSDVSRN